MLEMDTVTLCPIDRRLIDTALLDAEELGWFNAYHARVLKELTAELEGDGNADQDKDGVKECVAWLEGACAPL